MARKPRIWYPGATYHITARGNRRDPIFHDHRDYQQYIDFLKLCLEDIPFSIHAHCLMPNHIHLLLETEDKPPGTIIKFIHTRYAIYFNKRYDLTGHVFQGRFHANLVKTDEYFLIASKYIHLNPVEAKIVHNPEHYYWSSFPSYLDMDKRDSFLTTERTLSLFPKPHHLAYQTFVETEPTEDQSISL